MPIDLCKKCKVCKACGKRPYVESKVKVTSKMADYPYLYFMGLRYEPCGDEEHW